MIKKVIQSIKNKFNPPIEYRKMEEKIECAIDENIVDCESEAFKQDALNYYTYTGVPAPVYLKEDEWFGPAPEYSDKQKDYMKMETEIKRQEFEKNFSIEPDDIHQRMYEIATKSQNLNLNINPPGGSENFHEKPGNWNSGNSWSYFRNE